MPTLEAVEAFEEGKEEVVQKETKETMEPTIKFESSKEHYKAEACVVWCYDARFSDAYDEFLAAKGFSKSKIDLVKGAGGAQALAAESGPDHETFRSQIEKSIKLHHAERVVLMVHMDCGGYAFNDDRDAEWNHHVAELQKAADFVELEFPEIKTIERWIVGFDGMYEIK
jgi:rhodanese-related sulfurtransferase